LPREGQHYDKRVINLPHSAQVAGALALPLAPPYQFSLFASHRQLDEIIYTGADDTAAGRKARVLG
jgi:hypothetical protein